MEKEIKLQTFDNNFKTGSKILVIGDSYDTNKVVKNIVNKNKYDLGFLVSENEKDKPDLGKLDVFNDSINYTVNNSYIDLFQKTCYQLHINSTNKLIDDNIFVYCGCSNPVEGICEIINNFEKHLNITSVYTIETLPDWLPKYINIFDYIIITNGINNIYDKCLKYTNMFFSSYICDIYLSIAFTDNKYILIDLSTHNFFINNNKLDLSYNYVINTTTHIVMLSNADMSGNIMYDNSGNPIECEKLNKIFIYEIDNKIDIDMAIKTNGIDDDTIDFEEFEKIVHSI